MLHNRNSNPGLEFCLGFIRRKSKTDALFSLKSKRFYALLTGIEIPDFHLFAAFIPTPDKPTRKYHQSPNFHDEYKLIVKIIFNTQKRTKTDFSSFVAAARKIILHLVWWRLKFVLKAENKKGLSMFISAYATA